ncbi:hypothetical protein [Corallococcus exiguus]|uniref:hypothetical protein n=1 Tax=Corallococcus exiguus TaxID=83462 RepID=UPI0014709EDC|nr:hypothetical protein [Corallococcus exiguus]NNB84581.1 hypothetical protein [Corallococcus exiguus]
MALQDLTSKTAVLTAIAEFHVLGREAFLDKYGLRRARSFFIVFDDRPYDATAIARVAYGLQFPERGTLSASSFKGDEDSVRTKLEELGFTVQDITALKGGNVPSPALIPGRIYSWDELGSVFGFKPDYLGAAGGMVARGGSLLLITHPGGAKSFNYNDYWDDEDLIYTGRGKVGDQKLEGQNRAVAENTKVLFVFEPRLARRLHFLGKAQCHAHWWDNGEDDNGEERRILRFRLRFKGTGPQRQFQTSAEEEDSGSVNEPTVGRDVRRPPRQPAHRKPRPFDESRSPAAFTPNDERASPEETLALQEKAVQNHHALLVALKRHLVAAGWDGIEEIPSAVDLWAHAPSKSVRVIFEAKTLDASSELYQTRMALSQLFEYRHFHGIAEDELCLVTNAPVSEARERFLAAMGVAVLAYDGQVFRASGVLNRSWLAELCSPQ